MEQLLNCAYRTMYKLVAKIQELEKQNEGLRRTIEEMRSELQVNRSMNK